MLIWFWFAIGYVDIFPHNKGLLVIREFLTVHLVQEGHLSCCSCDVLESGARWDIYRCAPCVNDYVWRLHGMGLFGVWVYCGLCSFCVRTSNLVCVFYNSTDKVEALQTTTRHHYWHLVSNEGLICDCTLSNRFARLITVRCIIIFFYILYEYFMCHLVCFLCLVENIKKDNNTANCD